MMQRRSDKKLLSRQGNQEKWKRRERKIAREKEKERERERWTRD